MKKIFTLENICKILVENDSSIEKSFSAQVEAVNKLMNTLSENEILDLTYKAGIPFKIVWWNKYIKIKPYYNLKKGKGLEFKGYFHYHD